MALQEFMDLNGTQLFDPIELQIENFCRRNELSLTESRLLRVLPEFKFVLGSSTLKRYIIRIRFIEVDDQTIIWRAAVEVRSVQLGTEQNRTLYARESPELNLEALEDITDISNGINFILSDIRHRIINDIHMEQRVQRLQQRTGGWQLVDSEPDFFIEEIPQQGDENPDMPIPVQHHGAYWSDMGMLETPPPSFPRHDHRRPQNQTPDPAILTEEQLRAKRRVSGVKLQPPHQTQLKRK